MTNGARGLGAIALVLAFGCGGDDSAPAPQQRSMVREQPQSDDGDNRPPVVERLRLSPRAPSPSDEIVAQVDARDPEGDPVTLRFEWTVNGRPAGTATTLRAGIAQADDRVEVSVVALDGTSESAPMTARVDVATAVPVIANVSFDPPGNVKVGDVVTALVDVGNEDDESLEITYRWLVNDEVVGEKGKSLATKGMKRGDRIQVEVMAREGDQASELVRSAPLSIGNAPPVIKGIPVAVQDGDAFKYEFAAEDPDGDRSLRFSLTKAPAGMTIDPIDGVATWRPTKEQAGEQAIEVSVRDSAGATATLSFVVAVSETVPPPPAPEGKDAKAAPPEKAAPAKAAEPTFSDDPDAAEPAEAAEDE
jgi:hypothetical protein